MKTPGMSAVWPVRGFLEEIRDFGWRVFYELSYGYCDYSYTLCRSQQFLCRSGIWVQRGFFPFGGENGLMVGDVFYKS